MLASFTASGALRIGVLLLPPCSALGLGTIVEPLVMANRHSGRKLYEVSFYSAAGKSVPLYGGVQLPVHGALATDLECDALIVIAEGIVPFHGHQMVVGALARLARARMTLGAAHAGSYWLARAGLLNGYRATIHWEEIPRFTEEFAQIVVCNNLYEIDRDRFSSGGGAANLDMMLALIERDHGRQLSALLCEQLCLERVRPGSERQRMQLSALIGIHQPKLTEALTLMEANIEEPLTADEIAHYVGLSRRQLERLFKQFLNTLPSKYYLGLRLNRAREMLQRTTKSIVQIGLTCGFSSGPHFSTAYRSHFGITPREERAGPESNAPVVEGDG